MSKLNQYDLCSVLVSKNGLDDKEAHRFVKAIFDVIQECLDEDKNVKVKGLGTFKIIEVDDRESINVNTGERVLIEGHSKLTFTPDGVMKEIVNKPFSQFETVILNDGVDFPEPAVEESVTDPDEVVEIPSSEASVVEFTDEVTTVKPIEDNTMIPIEDNVDVAKTVHPIEEVHQEKSHVGEEVEKLISDETETNETPAADDVEVETSADDVVENSTVEDETKAESEPVEFGEEPNNSTVRWILASVVVLLLMLGAGYGGYLYGRYDLSEEIAYKQMKADLKTAEMAAKKAAAAVAKDSVVQEVDATKIGAMSIDKDKETAVKEEPTKDESKNEEVKKENKVKEQPVSGNSDKYEEKDARVRTGAYRIVGLDRTVKAKTGQTVEEIATRLLGPGMSCYVEVFNDIEGKTALKEGQIIKIPKLELKKRR